MRTTRLCSDRTALGPSTGAPDTFPIEIEVLEMSKTRIEARPDGTDVRAIPGQGPRGGKGPERTVVRGEPLPPTPSAGSSYTLVDHTKTKK